MILLFYTLQFQSVFEHDSCENFCAPTREQKTVAEVEVWAGGTAAVCQTVGHGWLAG